MISSFVLSAIHQKGESFQLGKADPIDVSHFCFKGKVMAKQKVVKLIISICLALALGIAAHLCEFENDLTGFMVVGFFCVYGALSVVWDTFFGWEKEDGLD